MKHYRLCEKCTEKKGGKFPEGHVCTVTFGECLYCKTKDVVLIPWVDFDWKNNIKKDRAAKLGRD